MELADEGSAIVFAFFCLLAGNVGGLTLNVCLLLPVALVWLRHSLMQILEAWGSSAMALLSPQSGLRLLVDCGPGITRPPMTLAGAVDAVGLFDSLKSCCEGGPSTSDEGSTASVLDGTVALGGM